MKKTIILYLILLCLYPQNIAQVNNDSLRYYFDTFSPYEALDIYSRKKHYNIDFKEVYYDQELKIEILKLLDTDVYIEYLLKKHRIYWDEFMKKDEREGVKPILPIKQYVTNICELNYDSIANNNQLYVKYRNFTLDWLVADENKKLQKQRETLMFQSHGAMHIHSLSHYPEAYKIWKNYWDISDKLIMDRFSQIQPLAIYLLRMNDPDIKDEVNKIVKKCVESNGYSENPVSLMSLFLSLETAYSIEKLIEMSSINSKQNFMSSDPPLSYDTILLSYLRGVCENENVHIESYDKDSILAGAKELAERKKKEEEYWMINMPFNK
ncbi:hypothetical protein [Dysgonomonas sp. 520]|uniref:hypothetical protein n=1 Tax=Dysgonomonas sp. 520 TaxID=2302931 RepID=UPI0013D4ED0B|nr:hypothetical protein [Dysgonomonas sp. 520]NDW11237.1 hypothetical protein [Dysgonomonas sp. 520]